MPDPAVHVIVFSRDRPLQLHGYLTSLFEQWQGEFRVSVLASLNPPYMEAYDAVRTEFRFGPYGHRIIFGPEVDFASDLTRSVDVGCAPLTCFGCDDAVFVRPVAVGHLPPAFDAEPDLLGVSLRLGTTVKRGMWGQEQAQPAMARRRGDLLLWDATAPTSEGDWAYPFDVVGTVYRTGFVRRLVDSVAPDSPSRLEEAGSVFWRRHAGGATHLACYHLPRLVLPTVNVVQPVFPNGTVGDDRLSPAFLLGCWNAGLRLDTWRYANGPQPDSWRVGDFYLRRAL